MSNGQRIRLVLSIVETDSTFRKEAVRGVEMWVGRCIFCNAKLGVPLSGDADRHVTVEHIVPRNHGGTDAPENLALACAQCNGEKGRRHDHRDRNDARRLEVTGALLERRKERWPAGARAPSWPSVDGQMTTSTAAPEPEPVEPRVSALYIYPLKSAAGIEVPLGIVGDRGFEHDRRFMLVDERGRFLSQREIPAMARLQTRMGADSLRVEFEKRSLEIPLAPPERDRVTVEVWDDRCEAIEVEGGAWFSEALGRPCRLVFMPDDSIRAVDSDYASHGEIVSFADGFPFLLVSQASVDELTTRVGEPMSVLRFRPNIVVEGCAPGAEDAWRRVRIGDVPFALVKPCSRCEIVTIDPSSGQRGKEPLTALAAYRKQGRKVMFGQNVLAEASGQLRVGDKVTVLD